MTCCIMQMTVVYGEQRVGRALLLKRVTSTTVRATAISYNKLSVPCGRVVTKNVTLNKLRGPRVRTTRYASARVCLYSWPWQLL